MFVWIYLTKIYDRNPFVLLKIFFYFKTSLNTNIILKLHQRKDFLPLFYLNTWTHLESHMFSVLKHLSLTCQNRKCSMSVRLICCRRMYAPPSSPSLQPPLSYSHLSPPCQLFLSSPTQVTDLMTAAWSVHLHSAPVCSCHQRDSGHGSWPAL